jgi:hypothetical protein
MANARIRQDAPAVGGSDRKLTFVWQFAFWAAMESVNMLTDVVLTAALISIVGVLSVPLSKKLILVFAFATRIL